jgi:hypothetical protein
MGTEIGRMGLAQALIPAVGRLAQLDITLTGITSPNLLTLSAKTLNISQLSKNRSAPAQTMLNARQIMVTVTDLNVSTRKLAVGTLNAESLDLYNLFELRPRKNRSARSPWQIAISEITIESVNIALTQPSHIPRFKLTGSLSLFDQVPLKSQFNITTAKPDQRRLNGKLTLNRHKLLDVKGHYHEPKNGQINRLIKHKKRQEINASYHLTLDLNTFKNANHVDKPTPRLQVQSLKTNLLGMPATAHGAIRFGLPNKGIAFENVSITVQNHNQKITGLIDTQVTQFSMDIEKLPARALSPWIMLPTIATELNGALNWQKNKKRPGILTGKLSATGHYAPKAADKQNATDTPTEFRLHTNLSYTNQRLELTETSLALECLIVTGEGKLDFSQATTTGIGSKGTLKAPALGSDCLNKHFAEALKSLPFDLSAQTTEVPNTQETKPFWATKAQAPEPMLKPALGGIASGALSFEGSDLTFNGLMNVTLAGRYDDIPFTLQHHIDGQIAFNRTEHNKRANRKKGETTTITITQADLTQNTLIQIEQAPVITISSRLEKSEPRKMPPNQNEANHIHPHGTSPWHLNVIGELPAKAFPPLPTLQGHFDAQLTLPNNELNPNRSLSPNLKIESKWDFQGQAFQLKTELIGTAENFSVRQTSVNIANSGPVTLSGTFNHGILDFQSELNRVRLPALRFRKWETTGTELSGTILLKGSSPAPILQANLTGRLAATHDNLPRTPHKNGPNNKIATVTTPELPPQVAHLFIDTDAEQFVAELALSADDHTWATMGLSVPQVPLRWPINLPTHEPAAITLWAELDNPSTWLTSNHEALQGELIADIQIPRLTEPDEFTGFVRWQRGNYENRTLGLLAKDISLNAERHTHNKAIHIKGHANDGQNGRYAITGSLPWPPRVNAQNNLTLTLAETAMDFRGAFSGKASGNLSIDSNHAGFILSGDVTLLPTFITLNNLNLSGVRTLNPDQIRDKSAKDEHIKQGNSTELLHGQAAIKHNTASNTEQTSEAPSAIPPIQLAVNINAPQQAYLRGRGLEAELSGQLRLNGTLETPALRGEFTGIRGDYTLFGRKFNLRNSQVQLDGNNVIYQLSAEHERADVQIQAEISGSQDTLNLTFTSVPDLPEDEIIAFLLFGKSMTRITPAQAIQLATALQQLRPNNGNGPGFDPLGKTRDFIQVDTLSIDSQQSEDSESGNTGGVTIGVGKYINDRVYIEFLKDSSDSKSWRSNVEVEIAPSLDLKTNAESGRGLSGIELQWHRDY